MALARVDAELLWLRTLGMLRNPNSQHDPRQIALDAYRLDLRRGQSYNFSEYLSVTTRAARAYAAAADVRADPGTAVVPPRNAIDPTALTGEQGYQYRVVVEVYDNGEYMGSTAVNVTSREPLSADEIGRQAVEVARGNLPGRDYPNRVVTEAEPGADFRTIVISAGRIA